MTAKPRNYYMWIGGLFLRALFGLLILAVCAFLLWRVFFSARVPSDLKKIAPNATLKAAYDVHGEELTLFTQEQPSVTKSEQSYGYFGVPRFVFIQEANQVQLVFRYNNSTLKAVQNDLGLATTPPRGELIFDVTLLALTDTTPEISEDNTDTSETVAKTRIYASAAPRVETTLLYTYFYYVFDGVAVTDHTLAIYLDVYAGAYFGQAPDYTQAPMGTLRLYHRDAERLAVELSRREWRSIAEFTP